MTRTKTPIIWIDWDRHLRSRTLAQRLAVELFEFRVSGSRIRRYLSSIIRTEAAIRKTQPEIVIATNPSLVLGFLLLALRKWYGFVLVSDAHYFGVRAIHGHRILQRLLDFHNLKADLVIVTNDNHAKYLARQGCRAYVCPDPLPDLTAQASLAVSVPPKSVFLVCSFDEDEPYAAAFAAFSRLRESGYALFVSGNYKKVQIDPAHFPWVHFLGFVSDEEYYSYLGACSVIVDLTTLEDCLVCGAYEALAAGKPLVISKTQALGDYFGGVALLTDNTPEAIIESVERAHSQRHDLARKITDWVATNERYLSEQISGLKVQLCSLRGLAADGSHRRVPS
jgi:glycosyltransferase involved in cell wall biosynthesis